MLGQLAGSLLGALGGRALGGGVGGRGGSLIGSLAGSLLGSKLGGGGGLGALLGGGGSAAGGAGGLAGMLGGLLGGKNNAAPQPAPSEIDDETAALMIRAMCAAANADGTIDDAEIKAILGRLGEVTKDEAEFVKAELSAPLGVDALVASVPKGAEAEIYAMSLLAIDSANGAEAEYLKRLAAGLGLSSEMTSKIREAVGV